ncbi:transposable element Tcb2 transposase [Trichonephila clavipes]|nr:transposable element Tcb2 transposase [Trichonephila clavipes]
MRSSRFWILDGENSDFIPLKRNRTNVETSRTSRYKLMGGRVSTDVRLDPENHFIMPTKTQKRCVLVIQAHVEPSLGAPVSSRTIRKGLAEGHLGSQLPIRVLPLTSTQRRLRLEWCHVRGNWTAVEGNQVVFSDESRFNLSCDDNCIHVWRLHSEHLNPVFALQ